MSKVTIVQVIYNSKKFIRPVFEAIFNQTFQDFNVVAVIAGNDDGSKEFLAQNFPQVEVIDPGYNIGFAKGHNLVFQKYGTLTRPSTGSGHPLPQAGEGDKEESIADFFQLVNPDLIMEPNYIENILKAFDDEKVGAATGKLYQVASDKFQVTREEFESQKLGFKILDSTGVVISKSGRARDRGQHEKDSGQYDSLTLVDGVSGAGCMFRANALQATSYRLQVNQEFFDEDFHSYWEDVDLSWRMKNRGWKNIFVPGAVAYHGRTAGSSKNGYADVFGFIKHHRALSSRVRQLNYKNHIFMYIKNSRYFYPQFFVREFFMFVYILIFETGTLKVFPELLKNLPKMWQKRKYLQKKIYLERSEESVV